MAFRREDLNRILFTLGLLAVLVHLVLRDRKTPLKWSKNASDPMEALIGRRNWHHAYQGPKPGYGRKSAAQRVAGGNGDPDGWEVVITAARDFDLWPHGLRSESRCGRRAGGARQVRAATRPL